MVRKWTLVLVSEHACQCTHTLNLPLSLSLFPTHSFCFVFPVMWKKYCTFVITHFHNSQEAQDSTNWTITATEMWRSQSFTQRLLMRSFSPLSLRGRQKRQFYNVTASVLTKMVYFCFLNSFDTGIFLKAKIYLKQRPLLIQYYHPGIINELIYTNKYQMTLCKIKKLTDEQKIPKTYNNWHFWFLALKSVLLGIYVCHFLK